MGETAHLLLHAPGFKAIFLLLFDHVGKLETMLPKAVAMVENLQSKDDPLQFVVEACALVGEFRQLGLVSLVARMEALIVRILKNAVVVVFGQREECPLAEVERCNGSLEHAFNCYPQNEPIQDMRKEFTRYTEENLKKAQTNTLLEALKTGLVEKEGQMVLDEDKWKGIEQRSKDFHTPTVEGEDLQKQWYTAANALFVANVTKGEGALPEDINILKPFATAIEGTTQGKILIKKN